MQISNIPFPPKLKPFKDFNMKNFSWIYFYFLNSLNETTIFNKNGYITVIYRSPSQKNNEFDDFRKSFASLEKALQNGLHYLLQHFII